MLATETKPTTEESDDPPPNRLYAAKHAAAIRAAAKRGTSRKTIENIYGPNAVRQILDGV